MEPYYSDGTTTLYLGDALDVAQQLDSGSVDCIVTSPPYFGLRDYGVDGQYGLESSPAEYVETMRALFAELRRVLADDGTLWVNLGDSYASKPCGGRGRNSQLASRAVGLPDKNLIGIPWRTALSLQDDGWILRSEIIWAKRNFMPESVTDRPTRAHAARDDDTKPAACLRPRLCALYRPREGADALVRRWVSGHPP